MISFLYSCSAERGWGWSQYDIKKKKEKKEKSILRPQEDKSPQAWQLIIHVYFHLQPRPDVSRNQGQAPVKAEMFKCSSSRNKASRLCQWRQDCRAAADCFTSTELRHRILILCWISMIFSAPIFPKKKKKTLKMKWYQERKMLS